MIYFTANIIGIYSGPGLNIHRGSSYSERLAGTLFCYLASSIFFH